MHTHTHAHTHTHTHTHTHLHTHRHAWPLIWTHMYAKCIQHAHTRHVKTHLTPPHTHTHIHTHKHIWHAVVIYTLCIHTLTNCAHTLTIHTLRMQKIKHSHFRLRLCTHTHKHIFLYYYNIFACNYVIFLQILCRMHFTVSLENSDASEPFLYYSQFQTESVLVYLWQNSTSLMVNVIFQWQMNHWSGENIWTTKVCPVTLHYAPALGSCIVCTAEISQFCLVVSCFSTPIHRCIPFVTHQFFLHSLLSLYNIFKQHICASHIKTIIPIVFWLQSY